MTRHGSPDLAIVAQASMLMVNLSTDEIAETYVQSKKLHASAETKFISASPSGIGKLECKSILEMFGK